LSSSRIRKDLPPISQIAPPFWGIREIRGQATGEKFAGHDDAERTTIDTDSKPAESHEIPILSWFG